MRYNLKGEVQRDNQVKAQEYLSRLINDQKPIELREIRKPRTNLQNKYLHAILTEWACECGYTIQEMKCSVKAALGYSYPKGGCVMYRETSKMDTKELSEFTEKTRKLAAEQGVYLMSPEEFERGGYIEIRKKKEQLSKYL
jgi:hypothetical protein